MVVSSLPDEVDGVATGGIFVVPATIDSVSVEVSLPPLPSETV